MLDFHKIMDYYQKEKHHKSKSRDEYAVNNLTSFFQGRDVYSLTRSDIRSYATYRLSQGVANSTVNRELRTFSSALNFYKLEHMLDFVNPVMGISLAIPDPIIRYATPCEAKALHSASKDYARTPHLPAFIRLAFNTGCRKNELFKLEIPRLDFRQRLIHLGSERTKSARRRFVPMNDDVIQTLDELIFWNKKHCPDSPYVFTGRDKQSHIVNLSKGFRGACQRAGIENFRIHDMRHTFASWLVQGGVSLYVVKDLLGHSSIAVTERYAHLSNEPLQKAVLELPTF